MHIVPLNKRVSSNVTNKERCKFATVTLQIVGCKLKSSCYDERKLILTETFKLDKVAPRFLRWVLENKKTQMIIFAVPSWAPFIGIIRNY